MCNHYAEKRNQTVTKWASNKVISDSILSGNYFLNFLKIFFLPTLPAVDKVVTSAEFTLAICKSHFTL